MVRLLPPTHVVSVLHGGAANRPPSTNKSHESQIDSIGPRGSGTLVHAVVPSSHVTSATVVLRGILARPRIEACCCTRSEPG